MSSKLLPYPERETKPEYILERMTMAIGWDVPIDVARHWDEDYELSRAQILAELWGRANDHACSAVSVELGSMFFPKKGDDEKEYIEARAFWKCFNITELPEPMHDKAREFCIQNIDKSVLTFIAAGPVTVRTLGDESEEEDTDPA